MPNMIFHLPIKIMTDRPSGSHIRPAKMMAAFVDIGYRVEVISGYGRERKRKIKFLKRQIDRGVHYDFVYSESSTLPTLLTEKHHLPLYPLLDFGFFKFCREHRLKICLYYRDIHWLFAHYQSRVKIYKQWIARIFYHYDLRQYNRLCDILYLPSLPMADYLPWLKVAHVESLWPGHDRTNEQAPKDSANPANLLTILYVGGIGFHYDLQLLYAAVAGNTKLRLIVCTRKQEWETSRHRYPQSENIEIVHKSGAQLTEIYRRAHLAALFVKPDAYWRFAMPLKLFEYLGHQKPILAVRGTCCGNFVEKHEVGWTLPYGRTDLENLLRNLSMNRHLIQTRQNNIRKILPLHTWKARARQVVADIRSAQK